MDDRRGPAGIRFRHFHLRDAQPRRRLPAALGLHRFDARRCLVQPELRLAGDGLRERRRAALSHRPDPRRGLPGGDETGRLVVSVRARLAAGSDGRCTGAGYGLAVPVARAGSESGLAGGRQSGVGLRPRRCRVDVGDPRRRPLPAGAGALRAARGAPPFPGSGLSLDRLRLLRPHVGAVRALGPLALFPAAGSRQDRRVGAASCSWPSRRWPSEPWAVPLAGGFRAASASAAWPWRASWRAEPAPSSRR